MLLEPELLAEDLHSRVVRSCPGNARKDQKRESTHVFVFVEFGPSAGSSASSPPRSWSRMRSNEDRRTGKDSDRVSSREARRSTLPTPCACGGRCDGSNGAGARGPVSCDWPWFGKQCAASPSGACKATRALLKLSNENRRGGNELQRSRPLSSAKGSGA